MRSPILFTLLSLGLLPAAARPQGSAPAATKLPTVVLVATGGTIAMKIDP